MIEIILVYVLFGSVSLFAIVASIWLLHEIFGDKKE